ncbi:MAG TPA: N-acetylmuramic acid 6-phosphate etherase [Fimbriimonadaceae bacterium]|nr:N-acetylmuramic acid 6-phosphate etherase [Fimbriimonadaceae bacterium]HRJ97814.1 N-acetylmuramic acid 6-phosphate etherase [Fimbriimonadaceae bacterium]
MSTEARNPRSFGLDKMSAAEIIRLMNEEEQAVFRAVASVEDKLAEAAQKVADAYLAGGRTIYVGAGTSGRIAFSDAAEMPPTFGVEPDRFVAVMAGGLFAVEQAHEDVEDDEHAAIEAINDLQLTRKDVLIGLAASGKTPFVLAAIRHAREKGVWTCGICNSRNGPLLSACDHPILIETGAEVLTGSTRLKAGTAQKLALNRISTAAMVLAGKVIENLMVDVKAKNKKLQERCVRIVRELTNATADEAREMLSRNEFDIRRVLDQLRPAARKG